MSPKRGDTPNSTGGKGRPIETNRAPSSPPVHPDIELRSTVVVYSESPNRCTIYPPGLTDVERMSTWISADYSAFVDLDRAR